MWTSRTGLTVLLLALGCAAAHSDDHPPADDPDPGFLEFLGSVDGLADTNPDYLSQAGAPATRPPGKPANAPPPPPPPPLPPPPSASISSGSHNE